MTKKTLDRAAKINLLVSLVLVLLLAIILETLIRERRTDAAVINLSGRQRMLSQKIAKGIYTTSLGLTSIQEIKNDAETWTLVHDGLIYGNDSLGLPSLTDQDLLSLFKQVEPFKKGLLRVVAQINETTQITPSMLNEVERNEQAFLSLMDEIVFQAEENYNRSIFNLRLWTLVLSILVIVSLVVLYFNLVKPIIRELSRAEGSLMRSRQSLEFFVKHTPAAVAMFDLKMDYLFASDRWYVDYGLEGRSIIGKNHYDIFPEINEIPEWKEIHQRILKGETYKTDRDRFDRADGKVDWLKYELLPWRDDNGEIGGMIMFTEVITQQVEMQLELERKARELEKTNEELKHFIYIASHDLQEPLRTTLSYSDLLLNEEFNSDEQVKQQSLRFIGESVGRMSTLVKGLLDYSLIGSDNNFEQVDCQLLAKEVFNALEQKDRIDVSIEVENLPVVSGSKLELTQLFHNLIVNSIKFVRPNVPCLIQISAERTNGYWIFTFSDNGIGIEEQYFKQIFKVFQRLHSKDRVEGSGIGLALSKKIVEHHGGEIWVESELNKGTTFYFTLVG
ncbi:MULTISPECIES: ATP-binding protein [Roseivirga]|nr:MULTISPECIES: ATP-binding protein [Roseivirga]MBO6495491.1 type IV pili methyl-accepting chemotaxis transducer N-terminal domain-containing protein [Roseivirga sp.]MBO6661733.1 type IV pili methyl-accepting chemotaxis transducer N-terminal domain-containing protein [Roseivirga sp.]MBO6908282.1 type IV pili methyl-accepting chemotaxis transducer N-terminal domain-containing protein [Roseivirga sp.]WPZ11177.1 ATP-binding protein [Roseivirga spongicola]